MRANLNRRIGESENRSGLPRFPGSPALRLVVCMIFATTAGGCRQDMHDQPKYKPYRPSPFFENGLSSRPLVEGTIPRGYLREDARLYSGKIPTGTVPTSSARSKQGAAEQSTLATGKAEATYFDTFPFPLTNQVLLRGQERFNIFCSVCHGRVGDGQGMIPKRGFRQPSSFHIDRLRHVPVGYLFAVITKGFGAMPDYADKISPEDRWAIVAYIRALQLSQHATLEEVPPEDRGRLSEGGPR